MLVLTFIPFLWAAVADWADITEVIRGHIEPGDPLLLSAMLILIALWGYAQYLDWWNNDRWDERLEKADNAVRESELLVAEKENTIDFLLRLGDTLLGVVGLKAERIRRAPGNTNGHPLYTLNAVLMPKEQAARLIHCVFELYRARLDAKFHLRVAYFRLEGTHFEVQYAYDGVSTNCIRTPAETHREYFRYPPSSGACLVATAAMLGQLQIIGDTDEADGKGRFRFFDEAQRKQIKSIVAIPLKRGDECAPIQHIITIDTNCKDFFSLDHERELEILAKNIAHRLLLEFEMDAVLGEANQKVQGGSHAAAH